MPGRFGEHLAWEEDAGTRALSLSLALPPATAGEGAAKRISVDSTIDTITAKDGDALLLEVTDVMQPLQPAKTSFHVLDNKTLVIAVTPTNALFPWGRHLIGACGKITTW
eukprot:PRCOL_00006752-RA